MLLGAWRSRRSREHPGFLIAGGVAAATLPDLDLVIPSLLDRFGIEHRLNSGTHHSWVTHTPLFWGLVAAAARRLAGLRFAPAWGPEAANTLALGAAVHLLQDSLANTVALFWPLRRREYGFGLDRLAGVTDHREYVRRYPSSPAGKAELGLLFAALLYSAQRSRPSGPWRTQSQKRSMGNTINTCLLCLRLGDRFPGEIW
jgi:hypothetical protein